MDQSAKPKPVNYVLIDKSLYPEPYQILNEALRWHGDLREAELGLAWRKNWTTDADGKITLGKCVKVSDLQREFMDYDFIIVLNKEIWHAQEWGHDKKLALMDHELCHATTALDEFGDVKYNEQDRPVFRTRKHDIEEFREVVERHGCYKADLEEFAKTLTSQPGLFDDAVGEPESEADEAAA
jgi:hypothetical protein